MDPDDQQVDPKGDPEDPPLIIIDSDDDEEIEEQVEEEIEEVAEDADEEEIEEDAYEVLFNEDEEWDVFSDVTIE